MFRSFSLIVFSVGLLIAGIANASKVTHDHVKGLFIFHKAPEQDVNVLSEAFRL